MDQPLQKSYPTPATLREAGASGRRIGQLLARRRAAKAEHDKQVLRLEQALATKLKPLEDEIFGRAKSIEAFANANREKLTEREKLKHISLPHGAGEISWTLNPPSLVVESGKKAIKWIRRRGLGVMRFVRFKEELNKEALLEAPEVVRKIEGVRIAQDEMFAIRPFNERERVVQNTATKDWSIVSPRKKEASEA